LSSRASNAVHDESEPAIKTLKADWFWAILLLGVFAALSLGSAWQESATYDEPLHVLSGVAAWKTGQIDLDYSNPPLANYWQTLPLLALRFHSFPPPAQLLRTLYTDSFNFVHHNRYSLGWMLQAPRTMNVILGLVLGAVLFRWARQALGELSAIGTVFTYAFCPALLAYGHFATADLAGALGWILFFYAAWRWKEAPSARAAAMTGFALGLALCLKYSTLLTLPALAGIFAVEACGSHRASLPHRSTVFKAIGLVFLGANLVMICSFRGWGLPGWLHGFFKFTTLFKEGHLNYYEGYFNRTGWKSYFVTAFLLKTPMTFLAAVLTGGIGLQYITSSRRDFLLLWCLWPAAFLLSTSSLSNVQVGIRHILPVYPFLCLWIGGVMGTLWESGRRAVRAWVILLGTGYLAGAAATFPRYLSYFNELVVPSANGYHYFVDSNLDWGQGLKALGDYLQKKGSPKIYFSYFGCGDPGLYGIRFQPVLMATCADVGGQTDVSEEPVPEYFAVSATNRVGLYYEPHGVFAWLNQRNPVAIFMDSIWLYDLSRDAESRERLRFLSNTQSMPASAKPMRSNNVPNLAG